MDAEWEDFEAQVEDSSRDDCVAANQGSIRLQEPASVGSVVPSLQGGHLETSDNWELCE